MQPLAAAERMALRKLRVRLPCQRVVPACSTADGRLASTRAPFTRHFSGTGFSPGAPLWTPSEDARLNSNMAKFMAKAGCRSYAELHQLSVAEPEWFWRECFNTVGMRTTDGRPLSEDAPVFAEPGPRALFPPPTWFPGAQVNAAQLLLDGAGVADAEPAYLFFRQRLAEEEEVEGPVPTPTIVSRGELRRRVARCHRRLRAVGVGRGSAVAGFVANTPTAGAAAISAMSVGAPWAATSPDFGPAAVVDRLSQVQPEVLFACSAYRYKAKRHCTLEALATLIPGLPSVRVVVLGDPDADPAGEEGQQAAAAEKLRLLLAERGHTGVSVETHRQWFLTDGPGEQAYDIEFEPVSFSDPMYIMFSSGTTGKPKCMAQGTGVLLNHLKELSFHCDMHRGDTLMYFTTTGWMMWNWMTSNLALGGRVALYDGDPLHPGPHALWRAAAAAGVKTLGVSARYLSALACSGFSPAAEPGSVGPSFRLLLSTGSPASGSCFRWVRDNVGATVQFCSISGGTDLNGCFLLGNPMLPVRDGELQCAGLGLDVRVLAAEEEGGTPLDDGPGELCCASPFPSAPLHFLGDAPGKKGRYFDSYFAHGLRASSAAMNSSSDASQQVVVWRHGDLVTHVSQNGSYIIHGRSDATLNPGGVRIGTADIYEVLEAKFDKEVADSLIVGLDYHLPDGTPDVRVALFVKLVQGTELTAELAARIRAEVRAGCSPRHVPSRIAECPEVPVTANGKKAEVVVKKRATARRLRQEISADSGSGVANRDALDWFDSAVIVVPGDSSSTASLDTKDGVSF